MLTMCAVVRGRTGSGHRCLDLFPHGGSGRARLPTVVGVVVPLQSIRAGQAHDQGLRTPHAFRIAIAELKQERRARVDPPAPRPFEPEEIHDLLDALGQLPANQRAALVLHYRSDLAVKEIATILGVSAATVKVHLHRGRKHLRDTLGLKEENNDV